MIMVTKKKDDKIDLFQATSREVSRAWWGLVMNANVFTGGCNMKFFIIICCVESKFFFENIFQSYSLDFSLD